MGSAVAGSLQQRVLAAVLRLGTCDVALVTAEVAPSISASQAAAAGRARRRLDERRRSSGRPGRSPRAAYNPRPRTRKGLSDLGRRHLVSEALRRLTEVGKIRRVRVGWYAPPAPKVFRPERAG